MHKKNVKNLVKNPFIPGFILWLIVGLVLLGRYSADGLHLIFNSYHHPFFDQFFFFWTDLGDGLFAVILLIIIFFFNRKKALQTAVSCLAAALITQLLKRLVFPDSPRPSKFFNGLHDLYVVDGLQLHADYSFPSGHATSAFALFLCLSLMTGNRILQLIFFFIAVSAAYSRVYLSQHFFADIYIGSIIGTLVAGYVWYLMEPILPETWNSPVKLNKSA